MSQLDIENYRVVYKHSVDCTRHQSRDAGDEYKEKNAKNEHIWIAEECEGVER